MKLQGPRLPRSFFQRDPVLVARELLGRILFYRTTSGLLAGRIVETEAYRGQEDPASHAYRGPTPRNRVMFGPAGIAYVYFTYGMHYCLNVTADRPGRPGAVLFRALEPLAGQAVMQARGDRGPVHRLLSGPGKIGRGFGLTLADNGRDLVRGPLGIAAGLPVADEEVAITARIGISRGIESPYRFSARSSRSVSGRIRAAGGDAPGLVR